MKLSAKAKKRIRITINALSVAVAVVMLAGVVAMGIPRIFGYKVYTVVSPSMRPALSVGGLIIVDPVAFEQIKENDIATFQSPRNPSERFTHRVVEIHSESRTFTTQGDANPSPDPMDTGERYLVGRVVLSIPVIGWPAILTQNTIFLAISAFLLVLWLSVEIELFRQRRKRKDEPK